MLETYGPLIPLFVAMAWLFFFSICVFSVSKHEDNLRIYHIAERRGLVRFLS